MAPSERDRPLLVYDGECSFCAAWIRYWQALTGDRVEYVPFQTAAGSLPNIPLERFRKSVQLVLPGGEVHSGAHAVFDTLAYADRPGWLWAYGRVPAFAGLVEWCYRLIARQRPLMWQLTRLAFGPVIRPLDYRAIGWLFLKLLGAIYLIAFLSFGYQASGLIGSNGILPLGLFLGRAASVLGGGAWRELPSVFWLNSSDAAIHAVWIAGAVCAGLVIAGFFERPALALAWVLYLSLTVAGQDFMSFQWDSLLLESGALAVLLGWSPKVVWLYRWLVFRLMFESGAVKLLSGDPSWRHFTALTYHYQTQPLPTVFAWYAQLLPRWFQVFSCAVLLGIELGLPWLIFAPRRLRHFAGYGLFGLQCLIALTGNYAFFNLLAVSLLLFLFDDEWLGRLREWALRRRAPTRTWVPLRVRRALVGAMAVIAIATGVSQLHSMFAAQVTGLERGLMARVAPLQIVNAYGLFSVMTTRRLEIQVEGSNDGVTWLEYEFPFKPGPLDRRPRWAAPYQPRLDWQMWFAALSNYRVNPWFVNFVLRLLQGSPGVLHLLAHNPFPQHPPQFVRALIYEYRFTNWDQRRKTGNWWSRELLGTYLRQI